MHHALETQEIISTVFHYFSPSLVIDPAVGDPKPEPTLAALARTCRAFKEPALDALWMVLTDLHPLVGCLPEVSHQTSKISWGFSRPLSQAEWDVLRSYTRRARSVGISQLALDEKSFEILSGPPTTESLFPNLRYLRCEYTKRTMSLLQHLPLPSLILLHVMFDDSDLFRNSLDSFPAHSPNITKLHVRIRRTQNRFGAVEPILSRWQKLSSVNLLDVALDKHALLHLSRTPTLTQLFFTLADTFLASNTTLAFPNLRELTLIAISLPSISRLLADSQLPALTCFRAWTNHCPSKQELSFFFNFLLSPPNASHSIEEIRLKQANPRWNNIDPALLGLEDLQPCIVFGNLRRIDIGLHYGINLTDNDLLTLASAWHKLQHLNINHDHGWNSQRGITLDGLVRLLQTCRSLHQMTLCLDTRGYTEVPSSHAPEGFGMASRYGKFAIDVLDAPIEPESIPAITAFFSSIAVCCESGDLYMQHWNSPWMSGFPNAAEYKARWQDVRCRISDYLKSIRASNVQARLLRGLIDA